jgi:murein DD-endopeptidase MepM/ murein hydrolase activator NlpD
MYKKIILPLTMTMISSVAFANTPLIDEVGAYTDAADSSFYLENSMDTKLSVFHPDANGKMTTSSQITIPEKTIIAVKLSSFAKKVNNDWVCGVRIVDVMDEELRDSQAMDEEDFCIQTNDVKKLSLLDSSNGQNKEAFANYQKTGQVSELYDLSCLLAKVLDHRANYFSASASSVNIISPLKNSKGLLVATSEYGMRPHPVLKGVTRLHKGIDLRAAIGHQVVSVYDGKVLATRTERNRKTKKISGYGHYVIVVHPQKQMETVYAHLSAFRTKAGKVVTQGEPIALSGNSGIGTAPHLHFEIHVIRDGKTLPVNPRRYIDKLLNENI